VASAEFSEIRDPAEDFWGPLAMSDGVSNPFFQRAEPQLTPPDFGVHLFATAVPKKADNQYCAKYFANL
jgi:hypothetical protein